MSPDLKVGDRVIITHPSPNWNGLGVIVKVYGDRPANYHVKCLNGGAMNGAIGGFKVTDLTHEISDDELDNEIRRLFGMTPQEEN